MTARIVPAAPRSNKNIEDLALGIIMKCQPGVFTAGEAFDIERFFECHLEDMAGVETDYIQLDEGVYGYTDSETRECVISLDLVETPHQRRFYRSTTAHESGHGIMHVDDYRRKQARLRSLHGKNHQLRMYRADDVVLYRNPEWQAYRFAGALMMPARLVEEAVNRGFSVEDLSNRFDMHPAFVHYRLKSLGLQGRC